MKKIRFSYEVENSKSLDFKKIPNNKIFTDLMRNSIYSKNNPKKYFQLAWISLLDVRNDKIQIKH